MININAEIIFFALQKLSAIKIEFHISYQCPIMSEITLNITLHVSNCNRLHFIPQWLLMKNINAQIIFFALQKLIAITIEFHLSYEWAIMSEITLNITLHVSNCNRLLRHFIPSWLPNMNINAQIIFFALEKLMQ